MSELEQLKKENAELVVRVLELETAIKEAMKAMVDEKARALADIKADAIMEVANNWIIRKDDDYNIRRKLVEISNKLRGES